MKEYRLYLGGDSMDNKTDNLVKVIGLVGTVLSVASTLVTSWANDQKTDKLIEDKVQEAIKNMNK